MMINQQYSLSHSLLHAVLKTGLIRKQTPSQKASVSTVVYSVLLLLGEVCRQIKNKSNTSGQTLKIVFLGHIAFS